MWGFIKKNRLFFILFLVFIVAGSLEVFLAEKGRLVIGFNRLYTPAANFFFMYYTHVGDGLTMVIICLFILLFFNIRLGITGLLIFGATGLVARLFKQLVFGPIPRPHRYFEGRYELHKIDGVDIAYLYSFPSGHTITFFALFSFLAFLVYDKPLVVLLCFALAVLGGISRIYLAQHFAEDVLAGAIVGVVFSGVLYYWLEVKRPGFFNRPALDKPLLKI